MKKKIFIFGVVLSAFIMLMIPSISAFRGTIYNDNYNRKIDEIKNVFKNDNTKFNINFLNLWKLILILLDFIFLVIPAIESIIWLLAQRSLFDWLEKDDNPDY